MRFRFPAMSGEYESVVLGYVDILGYSAALRAKCEERPDYLLELFSTIDFSTHLGLNPVPIEVRIISDGIAIWTRSLDYGYLRVINTIALLQRALFQRGFLIRGVVTVGKHFCSRIQEREVPLGTVVLTNDEVIVSPALVRCGT